MSTHNFDFFSQPTWSTHSPRKHFFAMDQPAELLQQELQASQDPSQLWIDEEKQAEMPKEERESSRRQGTGSWLFDCTFQDDVQSILKNWPQGMQKQSGFLQKSDIKLWQDPDIEEESGMAAAEAKAKRSGKYNILTKEQKEFYVAEARRTTITHVAAHYGVCANNLSRWMVSCERRPGAGRRVADLDMENRLKDWIQFEIIEFGGFRLTRKIIQAQARSWSRNPGFKASKGWLERFVRRSKDEELAQILGFSLRRADESSQSDSSERLSLTTDNRVPQMPERRPGVRSSERLKCKRYSLNGWTNFCEE